MKYIFLSTLLFNFTINAQEKQIITPYEPSFSAKHPLIYKNLQTAGIGLLTSFATYAGLKYINEDSRSALKCVLFAGALGSLAHLTLRQPAEISLLDAVICHPPLALRGIRAFNSQLEESIKQKSEEARTFIEDTERIHPLVLLTECISDGGLTCALSRLQNPRYRTAFEEAVGKALTRHAPPHRSLVPLQFVSLGAGLPFQELVTLTKWLAKNPAAEISIHLIDKQYWPLAACNKKLDNRGQITESPIDPAIARNEIIERVKRVFGTSDSDEVITQKMSARVIKTHMAHQQLLKWLTSHFPRANLNLSIHENAQEYLNTLKFDALYPDVISAVDIEGETNIRNRSMDDYCTLCAKTLEKKPYASNVLLFKNEQDQPFSYKPALVTCNLTETPESEKGVYKDFNDQKQSLFFKIDLIDK